MKSIMTFTAVAALIAGMSIASAQNAPANKPSSMNKGSEPTTQSGSQAQPNTMNKTGAASTSGSKMQVTGTGKFCVEQSPGGALDCKFANLAACEKEGKANNLQCKPNPNTGGTTGAR